jgi:putative membrane protein
MMMADLGHSSSTAAEASAGSSAGAGANLSLISTQLSWMRSDLSNLRTLLAWARTSVSMIGFGFTIYNFYRGFLQDIPGPRGADAARNLGLALVAAGTLAMAVAVWNYWSINKGLEAMDTPAFPIPNALKQRWIVSYATAAVIMAIGLFTLLFMLRVL